jgi:hypothetical protein
MRKRILHTAMIVLGTAFMLGSFQNCGKGFETEHLENASSSDGPPSNGPSGESLDPEKTCAFNGQEIANGQPVTAYRSSNSSPCAPETRTCMNGALTGTYEFASCNENQAGSCIFNTQTIPSGGSVTAYSASTVPYGQSCATVQATRTCTNGALSGTAQFGTCTPGAAASCTIGTTTIPDGKTGFTYYQATAFTQASCDSLKATHLCLNGSLYPGIGGNSLTCQVTTGRTCRDAASGDTYAHNSYFWIIGSNVFENSWFGAVNTGVPLCRWSWGRCFDGTLTKQGSLDRLSCADPNREIQGIGTGSPYLGARNPAYPLGHYSP